MNTRPKSEWELRAEKAERERDEARAQFDRHVVWASERDAEHCACIHDGRGTLTSECQEHQELREQRDQLLDACRRLLKFNEELCADVNVSTHYPSADFARAAIAKAEGC